MPKTFHVACPQCKALIIARQTQIGTRTTCPDCLEEFFIDSSMGPETAPGVPDHARDSQFAGGDLQDSNDSFWDDGLATIKTSLFPPNENSKPILPARDEETPYGFSTVCPLCGTRQDTTSEQIGRKAKCPDCHLIFVVP